MSDPPWRLWVDSGGTFTDCIAIGPDGEASRLKVLSSGHLRARVSGFEPPDRLELAPGPGVPRGCLRGWRVRLNPPSDRILERVVADSDPESIRVEGLETFAPDRLLAAEVVLETGEPAPVMAARLATATPIGDPFPPLQVRLATTRGTNALLERRGRPTALFVTRGFADLLEIGDQRRPDLFALEMEKAPPLENQVLEVDERLDSDGGVVAPVDLSSLETAASDLPRAGIDAAAVALLHSYRNPAHEEAVGGKLRELGFAHVSLSSRLSSRIKILPRAQTAVVDAYLSAAIGDYLEGVRRGLDGASVRVLTSSAGVTRADRFRPKDSLLSGPAGGALGAAVVARRCRAPAILAFDMGGTSTDVTRWAGELPYRHETRVGDARLLSPSVAVETVAAGGGSVCSYDGRQLKVGPESARADPGPACYGAGGPLTVTDVNLLLGRLSAERFPFAVDRDASRRRLAELRESMTADSKPGEPPSEVPSEMPSDDAVLVGLLRIANEKMAAAVRRTSVRRGYRPSDHWLVAFGGAGPQHACALASLLGIRRVVVPQDAAILSAVGLGEARAERIAERQVLEPLDRVELQLPDMLDQLAIEATAALSREGVSAEQVRIRRKKVFLRLAGQESSLEVDAADGPALRELFIRRYRELFGYEPGERRVEVESILVVACGPRAGKATSMAGAVRRPGPQRMGSWFDTETGERSPVPVLERLALEPGARHPGPALVVEDHSVTVVEPGWRFWREETGDLQLLAMSHMSQSSDTAPEG